MNIRIRPSPATAERLLETLRGQSFKVVTRNTEHADSHGRTWTEELRYLEEEAGALATLRELTGCADVEVVIEGDFRPPGEYPFSRLTVVINDCGQPVRAFFG